MAPPLRVLIVGGGIAGNALAFWLKRLNHQVTILERFPHIRDSGLQIDLRDHGIQVLKRMDLDAKFREKSAPERGMQVMNSSGNVVAHFPVQKPKKDAASQSFTSEYEIMRGDFVRLLTDATKVETPGGGSAKYIYDASLTSFSQDKDGVDVRLSNGETGRYDLVVGADGVWSKTRGLMLEAEKRTEQVFFPLDNLYIAYFNLARLMAPGEDYVASVYMGPHRTGMMMRRHHPDSVQIYIGGQTEDEGLKNVKRGDVGAEKKELGRIMRESECGWIVDEIVDSFDKADDFYLERMGLVKMDHWSSGRVTLLGDAAWCPSAQTGMGTTSAFVGAYVLAGELSKDQGLDRALQEYEKIFRPFMDKVTDGVLEGGGGFSFPDGKWVMALMNGLLRVISFLRIDLGRFMRIRTIKGWDVPSYPELDALVKKQEQ